MTSRTQHQRAPILCAKGLRKSYSLEDQSARSLVGALVGKPSAKMAVEVVKGVDLEIYSGESVGILGRNGAGKTTLLSLLGGVLQPTAGTVERLGTVATVLGTGESFQRELSGLDNAALFCETLGLSGPAKAKAIEVVERFADLGDYFRRPLRTYSSGMQARLGFACAANVEAQLIIVDEVLAVGDAEFRLKCINHIETQQRRGATYLLVSHSAGLITSICTRAIVMDAGEKLFDGAARDGVAFYRRMTKESQLKRSLSSGATTPSGALALDLTHFAHMDPTPESNGRSSFEFTVRANEAVRSPEARVALSDGKGIGVSMYRTKTDGPTLPDMAPGGEVSVSVTYASNLTPGRYYYRCSLHSIEDNAERMTYYSDIVGSFDVFGEERAGLVDLDMQAEFSAVAAQSLREDTKLKSAFATDSTVAFFLHLPGDVDALAPIIDEARLSGRVKPIVMAHESLLAKHPRAADTIDWLGLPVLVAKDADGAAGWLGALHGAAALFTATETTLRPHRAAHELSAAAAAGGLATFAVQHGFENVGLSYFDEVHGVDVRFAAQTVLSWMPPDVLPAETPQETRDKVKVIGRPRFRVERARSLSPWPGPERVDIAVFENLHWHRYSATYRQSVLNDLEALCAAFPDLSVFVRPHPEGRWLTDRFNGVRPSAVNLVIAEPTDPAWRSITAEDVLSRSRFVLTTPSTVALDAAERGIPVGVFAYDLPLPLYAPLPLIDGMESIRRLVEAPSAATQAGAAFVARTIAAGGASRRALDSAIEKIGATRQGRVRES